MTEQDLRTLSIPGRDEQAVQGAKLHWNNIAKPLGSLGDLEEMIVKIAGITGKADFRPEKKALVICCGDNGVVAQSVSQSGNEVTTILAEAAAVGRTSVFHMAKVAGVEVFPVDVGIKDSLDLKGLRNARQMAGTMDMSQGPAMSRDTALGAIQVGIDLVAELKQAGFQIICTGEIGIGNTTSSSAMAAVLLDQSVEAVTGRGAGLSDERLARKIETIQKALEINQPDKEDPLGVLAKVGGLDIAALAGIFIGGALYQLPIVVDGFISSVAALTATLLCPGADYAFVASHLSGEPAGKMLLDRLGLSPLITAHMRLGEGTGAVMLMPLLEMGYQVYHQMDTFGSLGIVGYT